MTIQHRCTHARGPSGNAARILGRCMVAVAIMLLASAAYGQPAAPKTHLKVGDAAPDFSLTDTNGKAVKLSDFRGTKNVVLAFYVLAFTGG